jgi:DNA-binding transcriptional MerR regulator
MAPTTTPRKTAKLARRRAPARSRMIEIEVLARETGLHPELVRRLVRLGMIEPAGGTAQAPLFRPDTASRLALVLRLRRDLGLNYAGAVLAGELLARIDQLEERLRRYEPRTYRKR